MPVGILFRIRVLAIDLTVSTAVAPWFEKGYQGGGYLEVDSQVGSLIDWYNIQFYNQKNFNTGAVLFVDCDGLLNKADQAFPGSSLFEIAQNGFELNKLVIGKPGSTADAGNGFMGPKTLGTCVDQAAAAGWKAGIMAFQFPHADAAWIKAAKGTSFQ